MKKLFSSKGDSFRLFVLMCAMGALPVVAQNPQAKPEAVVCAGNARFTVLTPEMIRIEYSDKGVFEDRATFTIQNRAMEQVPAFSRTEDSEFLYIQTSCLKLKYRKGASLSTSPTAPADLTITLTHNGQPVEWFPGKPDPLNLKGTYRTLDESNGDNMRAKLEDGLISRSGWAVINDSWSNTRSDGSRSYAMTPNDEMGYDWWAERKDTAALDLYFLGYGSNYKQALADYTKVAGKIPLPPNYVFGYWYSRYAAYTSDDVRQIMADLKANNLPADVMIIDMDWHWNGLADCGSKGRGSWTGWSWNTNLFPDAPQLLADIHANDLKVALNLHPAQGVNAIESPQYYRAMTSELGDKYVKDSTIAWSLDYTDFTKSFFKHVIRDHEREGVDFWWLDWQQYLTSPTTPGLGETFWCNHVFFNDMNRNRPDHRPVIFHRWGGLGCHRYQIGFSGDASINYPTLAFQPYFTATASNVGYTYWGHDLGGHNPDDKKLQNDPELVLRWVQFGIFTPIFRTHATKKANLERRLWKFGNFPLLRDAVKLRYALFPYIYTMARKTYDTGIGLCRPLYYEYPDVEEAYSYEGEYFFGDNILVAPITEAAAKGQPSQKTIWFPAGKWWSADTRELIEGPCVKTLAFTAGQIPYFYKVGAVVPLNPPTVNRTTAKPAQLVLHVVAGDNGSDTLYEDEGDNNDYATNYAVTHLRHTANGNTETYTIEPRQGEQTNLVQTRSWVLQVVNARAPKSIHVNGVKVADTDWRYDASTRELTVMLPATPCSHEIAVAVRYQKN